MSLYGMSHDYLISYMIIHVSIPWLGQAWASPTITWLFDGISIYGHSILRSNSKLHENLWYMQTSAHTSSHHPMPPSLTLSTWILAARIPLRRKGKVSLMTKRNTESIEKRLKKETAGDFLHAGEEMLFINSKVSWSQYQQIQSISVAFEPGIYNVSTGFTNVYILNPDPVHTQHDCSWYRHDYQVHPQVNFCRHSCPHWPLLPYTTHLIPCNVYHHNRVTIEASSMAKKAFIDITIPSVSQILSLTYCNIMLIHLW